MRARFDAWTLAAALTACQAPAPYTMLSLDASTDAPRPDVGPVLLHDTGPRDTGATDTGTGMLDAPGVETDAGVSLAIRVDGLFDEAYWNGGGGNASTNATPALTPYEGDAITVVHYGRDANWLYVGVEATLVPGDAIALWLDTPAASGVLLNGTGLADRANTVNAVLSTGLNSVVVDFQPQLGWGTSVLPHGRVVGDATLGWRTLAASPSAFGSVRANTTSACSATGCETAILLTEAGVLPSERLQFVVRLGRPNVGFSNQAHPTIDGAAPEFVSDTLVVPAAP